jgi:3-hydroxyisobutyrate dehydrogenase
MRIGVAGIGKMGAAIAARLIEAGHDVAVWNRTPDKAKAVSGATVAANPAELAQRCEAVITILTDAAAIDAVYKDPSGLLSGDVAGKLFIEMSTVLPKTEIALAEAVRGKGATFVECPVGSGAVLKFTVNLPLMVYWQALGEALALARSLPVDPVRLMDLLSDTSGAAAVLKVRAPGSASMLKGGDAGPVTFNVDSAIKDMKAMLAEGKSRGIDMPLVENSLACYEECKRNGSGAAEISALSVYWAGRAKQ